MSGGTWYYIPPTVPLCDPSRWRRLRARQQAIADLLKRWGPPSKWPAGVDVS